jgi:phospho-N-acetylmuramoyl-pentapeptide-transferase
METAEILRIFILTSVGFVVALLATPLMTNLLYKFRFGKSIRSSDAAPIMSAMHSKKSGTPTMGGVLIWFTALLLAVVFGLIAHFFPESSLAGLNFLTRSETLLPLGLMVLGAIVGMFDDVLNILKVGPKGGGLSVSHRFLIYTVLSSIGAWWFYSKLEFSQMHLPFLGDFSIGIWYIPFFILVMAASTHALNITDGLDGLAGGSIASALSAYLVIAFVQGRFDLAVMLGVVIGTTMAFLWFNVNPARFFMGDTGSMSLGFILATVAMLTDTAFLLPIIALLLVIETLSVIVQVSSKKLRKGKKVFKSAPIHHHFEALGWPETKVVMRFWIVSAISAVCGLAIFLLDRGFTL